LTRDERGYTLLEVLIALGITLVVMALVARTLRDVARIFRAQSDLAAASSSITRALDDIGYELTLAGQGLGEGVVAVMPRVPGGEVSSFALTLRSNPNLTAGYLTSGLIETDTELAFTGADAFEPGETVLLTDARRSNEVAEVVKRSPLWMKLRSLETTSGDFRNRFTQNAATRALGLREVRYYLRASGEGEGKELVKDVTGVTSRVLARDIIALTFVYLDANGKVISAAKVEDEYSHLETIRLKLQYSVKAGALEPLSIVTAVSLRPASGTVDFERPDIGFRLSRILYPLEHPIAVVSRLAADRGVVVGAGTNPRRDPSYVYTFQMEQQFMSATVDSVAFFEDVRGPVAAVLGPERGPLAGSLFVAAAGLRIGHITRMLPDENGNFSSESEVIAFDGTDVIAQAGGIAFGVEGALYVMSQEKGAIYRYRFDSSGKPGKPERVFGLTGTPGPVVEGSDGHLYFLLQHGQRGSVWRMAFDETLEPVEPELVGRLDGAGVSLARDPVEGSLLCLVRARNGDFVILELSRAWLRGADVLEGVPREDPPVLFSLREWVTKLEEGRVDQSEIPFSLGELAQKMGVLRIDNLDFLSFDSLGSLYMGAWEENLVLKFQLARPSRRYAVGVAAGVVERGAGLSPMVRIHAWRERVPGL